MSIIFVGSLDRVAVFVVQNATLFSALFEDEGHYPLFLIDKLGVDSEGKCVFW
jgi:hypothetical protein